MKQILPPLVSILIAMIWYHLGGSMDIAIFFFLILWLILALNPIKFQNPRLREAYRERIRRAKERKRELEEARLAEKERLKDDEMEREERLRRDFEKIKKRSLS